VDAVAAIPSGAAAAALRAPAGFEAPLEPVTEEVAI
jgi:hypothetical protein